MTKKDWQVIDYFESGRKEHWINEIKKSDWGASAFLYELLRKDTFFETVGEKSKILLLTDGNELISFCTYAEKDDIQPTNLSPWMGFVYTFPKHRGHRYVGMLFDEVERIAQADKVSEVYISTNHIGLYEKYGCEFKTEMKDMDGELSRVYVKRIKKKPDIYIPDNIRRFIGGKSYSFDDIGMSGSQIMIFADSVLKRVKYRKENEETVQMMRWLEGKIPIPRVICFERDSEYQYLLMSKVSGKMSCDEYYLEHPKELLRLLAEAMKMLWSVDISDCPRNRNIDAELKEARYRVENNLVDLDNAEPTTFGDGGFKDPKELLQWLEDNRPDYEPVLSHGDFCLPNIFIENGGISGFIDLGDTGIGDKWRDIALCYRSLKHNFDGSFGGKVYPDFHPEMLFDALEIKPNPEKLKFYILLDELF